MWMLAIFVLAQGPGGGPQVQMAGGFATRAACDATGADIVHRLESQGAGPVDHWCYPQD